MAKLKPKPNPYRSSNDQQAQTVRRAFKLVVIVTFFAFLLVVQNWAMTNNKRSSSSDGKGNDVAKRLRRERLKYIELKETVNFKGNPGEGGSTAERDAQEEASEDVWSGDGGSEDYVDEDEDDNFEASGEEEDEDEDDENEEENDDGDKNDEDDKDGEEKEEGGEKGVEQRKSETNDKEGKKDNENEDEEVKADGDKKVEVVAENTNEGKGKKSADEGERKNPDQTDNNDGKKDDEKDGQKNDEKDGKKGEEEAKGDEKKPNEDIVLTMSAWRDSVLQRCQKTIDEKAENLTLLSDAMLEAKEKIEKEAIGLFKMPDPEKLGADDVVRPKYVPCKHAFIDLGTNIGDSVGYFVDAALDVCTPWWVQANKPAETKLDKKFPRPHLDLNTNSIIHRGHQANPLYGLLENYTNGGRNIRLEDTCVYGMEGNPVFTERLHKLENMVMGMKPLPVKHLHIHTESVVMGKDGPTKLFLDQMTVQHNFWGSSVLSSAGDVIATGNEHNGTLVASDVEGISLTTLIKSTMAPFQDDQKDEDKAGGLLIIKMDVEGAEYQVIKDIAESNVLCDYIGSDHRNKVVMIVEWHGSSIKDKDQLNLERIGHDDAKRKLMACGVKFENLDAGWA